MRIIVCGSRAYRDRPFLRKSLSDFHAKFPLSVLIEGGSSGADLMAKTWAHMNEIPVMEFPAAWCRFGRKAGPLRNQWMLDIGQPQAVIAFPGGDGTKSMVKLARKAGVHVWAPAGGFDGLAK